MIEIAIIGAGIAGLEAAKLLSANNIEVHLFEKEDHWGENILNKAFLFPDFSDAKKLVELYDDIQQIPHIHLHLSSEIIDVSKNDKQWQLTDIRNVKYNVAAVLLTTGYTPFDARKKEELGYGIYKGVVTSLDMEKMFRAGKVLNVHGEIPKRVVFLQCVGSRDEKSGNNYCSKVCCITAVKQSIELRKLLPDAEIFIFYMDLRMWGQHFEELYRSSQENYNIRYVRGRISEASATFDGKIQIKSEDTLIGVPLRMTTDLLVLMVGMEPSVGTKHIATSLNINGEYNFAESVNSFHKDNYTKQEGIFLAGSCKRPMSIIDTLNDTHAAVNAILSYVVEKSK